MKVFETKLRGFHAKTVENIMSRTVSAPKLGKITRNPAKKGDNITTYLRKFQIDRENLNLAKRILLCDSEHDHQKYKRQWKKTSKFLRVRSNFKASLCNQEPRIFKHEPILGFGNILLRINFMDIESNLINFRNQNIYELKIKVKKQEVTTNHNVFTLQTLGRLMIAFQLPKFMKNKKIWCQINELKENNIYQKGKFWIKPSAIGYQSSSILTKTSKHIGTISYITSLKHTKQLESCQILNLSNEHPRNRQSQLLPVQRLSFKRQQISKKNAQHCSNNRFIELKQQEGQSKQQEGHNLESNHSRTLTANTLR